MTGGRERRATVGAGPVPVDVLRLFRAAGVPVVQAYGTAATAGFAALSTPIDYRFGTVGRPLPGLDARVAEDGELLLRGPNVAAGDGARAPAGGWLRTGDAVAIGPDGLLEIAGRVAAALAREERRVAPAT